MRILRILGRAVWKIARALLFGWLYWLQRAPGNRRYWQALGVIFLLVAGGEAIAQLVMFPGRIAPIENPAITSTHEIDCDRMFKGGTYIIQVNGARHECTGADSWCPYGLQTPLIIYDAKNPARCRVAHNATKLSRWERAMVLHAFGFFVHGLALVLVREHDPNKMRKVIGHGALLIAIGLQLLIWKFDLFQPLLGTPP